MPDYPARQLVLGLPDCFQAAIAALLRAGIRPVSHQSGWGHAFVQARFAGDLIHRRKVFSAGLRDILPHTLALRHVADYATDRINEREAARSLRWTRTFLEAVQGRGSGE